MSTHIGTAEEQEIIRKLVSALETDEAAARLWYVGTPIPAFGGRTAAELMKSGEGQALTDFLDGADFGSLN